ncbi:MAG TPA: SOS response-associated peptidase, partial [Polyangiaceae bacterium]|nr:SOS response-associated peptidase [Polyangiaceae bacterium]
MCGRFTLTIPSYEDLAEALGVDPAENAAAYRPRYNVAPSDTSWIFRLKGGKREILPASWGLVPWWSESKSGGQKPINARSETLTKSRLFRDPFARKRCVVLADGFFEWRREGAVRQPFWFRPRAGGLMLLGGIYDSFHDDATGEHLRTFSIVTVKPNADVADIHDRMPLVIAPADLETWVAEAPRGATDAPANVKSLLHALPDGALSRTPVSRRVNSVANDDPECLAPPEDEAVAVAGKAATRAKGARAKARAKAGAKAGAQLGLFGVSAAEEVEEARASGRG